MRKIFKIARKIAKVLFYTLLIVVVTAVAFSYYYKDRIATYVIKEINKNIATKIKVDKFSFSILNKFPNASIEFTNVLAESTRTFRAADFPYSTDTLFAFQHLFLEFDIVDVFRKNYRIKTIHGDKGVINLFMDKAGNNNFQFWKKEDTEEKQPSEEASAFNIDLKNLKLTATRIRFVNQAKESDLRFFSVQTLLKGNISESEYDLSLASQSLIQSLVLEKIPYIRQKKIELKTRVYVKDNLYRVLDGSVNLAGIVLQLSGEYITGADSDKINLSLKGDKLNVNNLINLLPESKQQAFNEFKGTGNLFIAASVEGTISNTSSPHIIANMGIRDGSFARSGSSVRLENVLFEGLFSNGKQNSPASSFIQIRKLTANIGKSSLSCEGIINNFNNPVLKVNTFNTLNVDEVINFLKIDTIEQPSGTIIADFEINTSLKKLNDLKKEDVSSLLANGSLKFRNAGFRIKGSETLYSNINGKIRTSNLWTMIDSLYVQAGESDYFLVGQMSNLFDYLLGSGKKLYIKAKVHSQNINLGKGNNAPANESNDASGSMPFPENAALELTYTIDNFKYGDFSATTIKTSLSYKDKELNLDDLSFNSMNGELKGSGFIKQLSDNTFESFAEGEFTNINLGTLFQSFDNFGQNSLKDKNLKGNLSGNIQLKFTMDAGLKIQQESILTDAFIEITKGEIIDYEPMQQLSKFAEVDELRHIRFDNLKNKIYIREKTLIIPEMEISSSAFNITGSGEHFFNNDYEYHIQLAMSELLWKKARKKKENTEFGEIADDGVRTMLPLLIRKKGEDMKIGYDFKKAGEKIKDRFTKEAEIFKNLFSKDKKGRQQEQNHSEEMKIEFEDSPTEENNNNTDKNSDDDEKNNQQQQVKKNVDKNENTFQIQWEDE